MSEEAWVIEGGWSPVSEPDYWVGSSTWSSDPYKALRFACRESAQQACDLMCAGLNTRICCHSFAQKKVSDSPIKYGHKDAYLAFEWLRTCQRRDAEIALCEWHRLALENKRLIAELAEIRQRAEDATEYTLSVVNREQRARIAELEREVEIKEMENRHLQSVVNDLRAEVYK